jgi:hypothetical protein
MEPFKIGNRGYRSKKEAISRYRKILNSYDFGQSLNDADFDDLIDLLNYDPNEIQNETNIAPTMYPENEGYYITDIKVSKVQFNTATGTPLSAEPRHACKAIQTRYSAPC